jgi:CubicO group peptidase (beta-lactamase class C family)
MSLLLVTECAAQASPSNQQVIARVEQYMQALTELGWFSGSILIAKEGKVLISKGYGRANLEHDMPNTPQTRFRLASVTKQFTTMAIMILQERGKLDVEDHVSKYLPDCPKAWAGVSIRHLMTNTSGIPDFVNLLSIEKRRLPSPLTTTIALVKDKPLEFKPGERFSYSNSGYILLGYIIEKVSGVSYESFIQANIFKPLGMGNSGYDHPELILKDRASGYFLDGDNLVNAPFLDMSRAHAAGALYSTVEDLFLWDQSLYTQKLVSNKSLEAILTPFRENYGYGWYITSQFKRRVVYHSGGIEGYASHIARYPDDKLSIIILSNLSVAPVFKTARDLSAIVFQEEYRIPKRPDVSRVDEKILDSYVGQYEIAPGNLVTISKEGDRLMMRIREQQKVELFPKSRAEFFRKVVDLSMTFIKDETGLATYMVFHVDGRELRARKIK